MNCPFLQYVVNNPGFAAHLGSFGERLLKFAKEIDINHPDVETIFNGAFKEGSEFSESFGQFLKLYEFVESQKLDRIQPALPKIKQHLIYETDQPIYKKLANSNFNFPRLLTSQQEREKIRQEKKLQSISLESFLSRKSNIEWDAVPDDFSNYKRNSKSFEKEISNAYNKVKRYKSLGCDALANGVLESIKDYRAKMEDTCFGFHRLPITLACLILAKMNGLEYAEESVGQWKITIPEDKSIFTDKFYYAPRVYPFDKFKSMGWLSSKITATVEYLDNFPKIGWKPLFDHYLFVLPTVWNFPTVIHNPFTSYAVVAINEKNAKSQSFNSIREARSHIDSRMIESGVMPILLGERDGKCYYISEWE